MRHQDGLKDALIRAFATVAFMGYVLWNIAWIAMRQVPPSILLAATGLPCPTTGCLRSLAALRHGDLRKSLLLNPFLIVFLLLTAVSFANLAAQGVRKRRLALAPWVGWSWMGTLLLAWIAKFALGPGYW